MGIIPLKPELKETIWGGNWFWRQGFHDRAGKKIGEMWYYVPGLPYMVKFIDAAATLSLQVHPDHAYARRREGKPGKHEAWYIWSADPGACIYYGFQRPVEKKEVELAIRHGTLEKLVRKYRVKAGDLLYVPPGTIHAIGAGVRLVEVQTAVDLTYRLYDWDRGRKLQLEKGLAVLNTEAAGDNVLIPTSGRWQVEVNCPDFQLLKLHLQGQWPQQVGRRPCLLVGLYGEGQISSGRCLYQVKAGTVLLLEPGQYWLRGRMSILLLNSN